MGPSVPTVQGRSIVIKDWHEFSSVCATCTRLCSCFGLSANDSQLWSHLLREFSKKKIHKWKMSSSEIGLSCCQERREPSLFLLGLTVRRSHHLDFESFLAEPYDPMGKIRMINRAHQPPASVGMQLHWPKGPSTCLTVPLTVQIPGAFGEMQTHHRQENHGPFCQEPD